MRTILYLYISHTRIPHTYTKWSRFSAREQYCTHAHTFISHSADWGFTEISERLILKVAAKALLTEKFLWVCCSSWRSGKARSCQSFIACCFILLSLESQSHLIWALHPTVPDPNLPPPPPRLPGWHGNRDQPCGTRTHSALAVQNPLF